MGSHHNHRSLPPNLQIFNGDENVWNAGVTNAAYLAAQPNGDLLLFDGAHVCCVCVMCVCCAVCVCVLCVRVLCAVCVPCVLCAFVGECCAYARACCVRVCVCVRVCCTCAQRRSTMPRFTCRVPMNVCACARQRPRRRIARADGVERDDRQGRR